MNRVSCCDQDLQSREAETVDFGKKLRELEQDDTMGGATLSAANATNKGHLQGQGRHMLILMWRKRIAFQCRCCSERQTNFSVFEADTGKTSWEGKPVRRRPREAVEVSQQINLARTPLLFLQPIEQSMLPRVALFDSLDSSVGSKPYASRDLDMRDMDTIDESLDRNGWNAAFLPHCRSCDCV